MTRVRADMVSQQTVALGLETALVQTASFKAGFLTAQAVVDGNDIAAFDGPPGTGKTTCARYVAQHAKRPCALATMPHHPAPLDLLRYTHLAITGREPSGTRFQVQNDLVGILSCWQGVLIVDELQNTQAKALQELVWLYEETNHSFGLVVLGSGVLTAVQQYPQLHSRIMGTVTFRPLTGPALLDAVQALDDRFASTPRPILAQHDQAACAGLLRRWIQTVRWLNRLGIEGEVRPADFAAIRTQLPALSPTHSTRRAAYG